MQVRAALVVQAGLLGDRAVELPAGLRGGVPELCCCRPPARRLLAAAAARRRGAAARRSSGRSAACLPCIVAAVLGTLQQRNAVRWARSTAAGAAAAWSSAAQAPPAQAALLNAHSAVLCHPSRLHFSCLLGWVRKLLCLRPKASGQSRGAAEQQEVHRECWQACLVRGRSSRPPRLRRRCLPARGQCPTQLACLHCVPTGAGKEAPAADAPAAAATEQAAAAAAAAEQAGDKQPASPAAAAEEEDDEDDEKETCGFCRFMKAGGCRSAFIVSRRPKRRRRRRCLCALVLLACRTQAAAHGCL